MRFGLGELVIILLIVLLLFGAKKLPEIAASLRRAIKEFRKAGKELQDGLEEDNNEEPK